MGIYQGGMGLTRYRILKTSTNDPSLELDALIKAHLAPKLRIDGSSKSESLGWVRPMTPTDEEFQSDDSHWDLSDCRIGDGVLLRVRYEIRKVPTTLIQTLVRSKLREFSKKHGKPMPKKERTEFKQELVHDLTKRSLPTIHFIDGYWQDEQDELLIFSNSTRDRERFETLFLKTFGTALGIELYRKSGSQAFFDPTQYSSDKLTRQLNQFGKLEPTVFLPSSSNS